MEQVRSFIAIELPDNLKSWLAELQTRLQTGKQYGVKWVNPYSIHLTLKFLGSIPIDSTREITNAMEDAIQGISPFHLEAKRLGVFPNLKRVQVIWVGISDKTGKLGQLHKQLESRLARLGFSPEPRPFTPHLTLARLRNRASPDERKQLGQLIASIKFETACAIKVDAINLMKSQLTREGAIYNKISSARLKKPLPTATA